MTPCFSPFRFLILFFSLMVVVVVLFSTPTLFPSTATSLFFFPLFCSFLLFFLLFCLLFSSLQFFFCSSSTHLLNLYAMTVTPSKQLQLLAKHTVTAIGNFTSSDVFDELFAYRWWVLLLPLLLLPLSTAAVTVANNTVDIC